jgi:hypothetical protein
MKSRIDQSQIDRYASDACEVTAPQHFLFDARRVGYHSVRAPLAHVALLGRCPFLLPTDAYPYVFSFFIRFIFFLII